ncbi:MAG TPA: type I-U CRISPR-associated protein Csb2 [Streptosporangiaceae bacterium]|nr:type I-U CRISPR-associated protein Csb2 [Streptosporangiaceae bacterium]
MAVTIAIRFPLGRYHATPWDRSVNEGATEWPPSPWRLLRALVATWYTRWPDLPARELDELLDPLGEPPSFMTPRVRPGHSRHYLPGLGHKKGEPGGTDLTLDPFLSIPRDYELLVRWDLELPSGQREVLSKLVELVPYLGRADSVCEARLLESDPEPDETWWRPGAAGNRQIRLLAPTRPVSRPALEISTVEVRRSRRTLPLGSALVSYATNDREAVRLSADRPDSPSIEAVRFAVVGAAPMPSVNGVLLADELHRVCGRELARNVDDGRRRLLFGTDGALSGHKHAHWVPVAEDERRGAAVRSVVAWAPCKLRASEVAALMDIGSLSGKRGSLRNGERYEVQGFPEVRLLFQAAGSIEQVAPELCGPARLWRSLTPYLPVRHRKREPLTEFLAADIGAELGYRQEFARLPLPVVKPAEPDGGLPDRWSREFRRYRLTEGMGKSRPGLGLRLEFAEEVRGPLLLGQLSHFGYGIFVPADIRDDAEVGAVAGG